MSSNTKSAGLKLLVKMAVSVFILTVLIVQVRPERLLQTFKTLGPLDLGIVFTGYLLAQFTCSIRWKVLANSMGIGGKLSEYYNYYLKGMFFNLFLPTAIGGDVGRSFLLSKKEGCGWVQSFSSILCERLSGLIGLMIYAVLGIFILRPPQWQLYSLAASGLLLLALVFTFGFYKLEHYPWSKRLIERFIIKDDSSGSGSSNIWPKTKSIVEACGISLIFHPMVVSLQLFLLYKLGGTAPFLLLAAIYGTSGVASMMPVSFNGIGLREGSQTLLLIYWGHVSSETAAALSLVWLSVLLISTLPGGILLLVDQFKPVHPGYIKKV